jgi:hypothetical protein
MFTLLQGVALDIHLLVSRIIDIDCTSASRYLTERALTEPGIFRLPGRSSRVEELREAFNRGAPQSIVILLVRKVLPCAHFWRHTRVGEDPDISDESEIHAVGSLLKRYLRDLPSPLLSDERFSAFNSAADVYQNNADEGILVIKQLVRDLPVCNAVLLKTMCEFLSKVTALASI